MPRNRSVRVATLSSPAQRSAAAGSALKSRPASALRRRAVAASLVVVSLALLTVYFRESSGGGLHGFESAGATVLRPFEVGAERIARPFRDAAGWFGGLIDAKSENAKLRAEIDQLRQRAILNQTAAQENEQLRALLGYSDSSRFPQDYRGVAARVIARPPTQFEQQVVVSAGSNAGVRLHDPVVTADGLVGQVTKVARRVSQVTLLTDETSATAAVDVKTGAPGLVQHGQSSGDSLVLNRVTKDQRVSRGDVVVTAGWKSGMLTSLYPKGIPIGVVTSVGQLDTALYKQVQIGPFVDFSSIESVLVLVSTK